MDFFDNPEKIRSEIFKLYELCGVNLHSDGLFYDTKTGNLANGEKEAYDKKFLGLISKTKRAEISFKNGKQHGQMKFWFPNGKIWIDMNFIDGKPHGRRINWLSTGEKELETLFDHGIAIEKKMYLTSRALNFFIILFKERVLKSNSFIPNYVLNSSFISTFLDEEYKHTIELANNNIGEKKLQYEALANLILENKEKILAYILKSFSY